MQFSLFVINANVTILFLFFIVDVNFLSLSQYDTNELVIGKLERRIEIRSHSRENRVCTQMKDRHEDVLKQNR